SALSWIVMDGHDPNIAGLSMHPSRDVLAAFGLGRLDDDASGPVAEHVSACAPCRSVVEAGTPAPPGGLVRAPHSREEPADPDRPGPRAERPPTGYELHEVVGEGGMGVVYRASQLGLGRVVALKQIRPEALAGPNGVARFRREAEAAA